jgi:hypothetical protein
MVLSLGVPLVIVGVSAMAISYATLIDVARVNGIPLPELFPVLVDVGTVATMIAAAQFRLRGVSGRWLAYTTFILLSGVSIVANATHAGRAADLTVTTPWAAAILAATPPAVLLAITHLVMMLVPDEKERAKLQALREQSERKAASAPQQTVTSPRREVTARHQAAAQLPEVNPAKEVSDDTAPVSVVDQYPAPLQLVQREETMVQPKRSKASTDDTIVLERVLNYVEEQGKRPTGAIVGDWLGGKTSKTGQRFMQKHEDEISRIEEREAVNS